MKVALALVMGLAALAAAAPTVDDKIQKTLASEGLVTVIVSMVDDQTANLRSQFTATRSTYTTREAMLWGFYNLMKGHADQVQAPVLAALHGLKASNPEIFVDQIWITNQIVVKNANAATIESLMSQPEVREIHQERIIPLEAPRDLVIYENGDAIPTAGEQWGLLDIEAEKVHATGNRGQGAVLSNIDTGVRYTHEALRSNWRESYGWYDPDSRTQVPTDGNGHGTHTMGTIAGTTNGIGVAPGAQWVACRGCGTSSCSESALLGCGQWTACPTLPDNTVPNCGMAPRSSSNSWGGGQGDTWYNGIIESWRTVNIAPLFSSGNSGPTCGSSNSPSDYRYAIAVGSTTQSGALSSFSSVGPSVGGLIKPDIAAPGSSVVSSYYLSDTSYSTLSGTSMACPHVAGLTGLLYSVKNDLTPDQIRTILTGNARPHVRGTRDCGGIEENIFPNHHVGYGRISAPASVAAAGRL